MIKFLISFALIILMGFEKYTFIKVEGNLSNTLFEIIRLGVVAPIFIYAIYSGIRDLKKRTEVQKTGFSLVGKLVGLVVVLVVIFSFHLNFTRKIPSWDATALYDARAIFLSQGMKFSEMLNLSRYDPQNNYYYLLYPPFTSLLHFQWRIVFPGIPVGVIYSVTLLLLATVVFVFSRRIIGNNKALFATLITVSNPSIFSAAIREYTNLPFTLYLLTGIFLLGEYIEDKRIWKLVFGALLIGLTQWIRFLEPIWIAVFLAFAATLLIPKTRPFLKVGVILAGIFLFGFSERLIWTDFVSRIAGSEQIVNFNLLSYLEPVAGVFSGALIMILIFYLKSWGIMLIPHLVAAFSVVIARLKRKELYFYSLVIVLSLLIYFAGLYFVSFQSVWWDKLGDSLIRSSTFLIPISGLLLLYFIGESRLGLKKK